LTLWTLSVDSYSVSRIVAQVKTSAFYETIANGEKSAFLKILKRHMVHPNGRGLDVAAACKELGMNRVTLWRKMRKFGIRKQVVLDVKP